MNKMICIKRGFLNVVSLTLLFVSCNKSPQIDMVFVENGSFMMGSIDVEAESDENPLYEITLNDFYISKYEITQAEWKAVMGYNPSYFKNDNLPVECVSYNDVLKFISKLNAQTGEIYRLPTEAEWEYAARGGNKSKGYKYSGSNEINNVAWYVDNSNNGTHPVGTKYPNELGIYDMCGNVYEWCFDWYDSTSYDGTLTSRFKLEKVYSTRIFRGGSWFSKSQYCRISNRSHNLPDTRNYSLGFRLALDP
ncbi:formylglycine-generating enzyme family protein [Dysgonomonas sp. 520]|uniref:formylglycine-generating enzyme family protein n=1 Tax=Dysgonomonas sp. 520 TaxID=2302931 RepID=UPI0013CFC421|nr:formylglycine-generating enzyme family protein [Dysgonomonas sp. 520]NDW08183.1 formylglycine-generating enzyme family protein [Dysgonomonas sp. 520]